VILRSVVQGPAGKVRRPGALSLHPISLGPVNRRVHFMRSSLNRRVHFMRSSLTRLLQATLVVLWLDGDGAYLPPVPAAARPQPASASHQRFRPLRAPPILLVMLFRSLRAPPVSPPCIPMQLLWYQLALGLFRSTVVLSPLACSDPWSCSSGHFGRRLCHHPALADLMQLLWYQLALGLFRSLVVLFRPLRAPPILCQLALGLFRSLVVLFRSLRAPPVSPPCISRPNAAAVVPVLSNSHAPWRSSLPQLWPDTSCRRANRPSRVSFGLSSGSSCKVRRPGALSLHPISLGPVNRRVHFMRFSLNRRVHFMRSSLTRLLQATLVVLWLDGDGAYLPTVPAAARPQPASASHQRFRPSDSPCPVSILDVLLRLVLLCPWAPDSARWFLRADYCGLGKTPRFWGQPFLKHCSALF